MRSSGSRLRRTIQCFATQSKMPSRHCAATENLPGCKATGFPPAPKEKRDSCVHPSSVWWRVSSHAWFCFQPKPPRLRRGSPLMSSSPFPNNKISIQPCRQSSMPSSLHLPSLIARRRPPCPGETARPGMEHRTRGTTRQHRAAPQNSRRASSSAHSRRRSIPPRSLKKLRSQAATLRQSDVLILNEVDQGVKRTDYRNVTRNWPRLLG